MIFMLIIYSILLRIENWIVIMRLAGPDIRSPPPSDSDMQELPGDWDNSRENWSC